MPNIARSERLDPLPRHPGPVSIVCGAMLCDLQVWSDTDWTALPEGERPTVREQVPGLGWVGAVPYECLN